VTQASRGKHAVLRQSVALSQLHIICLPPSYGGIKRYRDPSVCLSVPWRSCPNTLAACSLAVCGLRTRPRTDVDPPRVELPSAGSIPSRRSRPIPRTLYYSTQICRLRRPSATNTQFTPSAARRDKTVASASRLRRRQMFSRRQS